MLSIGTTVMGVNDIGRAVAAKYQGAEVEKAYSATAPGKTS